MKIGTEGMDPRGASDMDGKAEEPRKRERASQFADKTLATSLV